MADITLGKKTFGFDDLEKKYRNFFAPAFEVLIDNTNIVKEGVAVPRVTVDLNTGQSSDIFSFSVVNAYDPVKREFQWLEQYFALGKYVEIKMGYTDKLETVFYGIITSVSFNYPSDSVPTIAVTGSDLSYLMMKGKLSKKWKSKKISEVVTAVGKKYVSKFVVDDTSVVIPTIPQNDESDFSFLHKLAKKCNYEFFILGQTLYFRKPLQDRTPAVNMMFGKNLKSYSTRMSLDKQVSQVVVVSNDSVKKEKISAVSKNVDILGSNSKTGKDILKAFKGNLVEHIYQLVPTKEAAQTMADARLNQRAMELVNGEGESIGLPELQAGRYIQIEGVGKKMNQTMFLKTVKHSIDKSGYITKFTVGGNAI